MLWDLAYFKIVPSLPEPNSVQNLNPNPKPKPKTTDTIPPKIVIISPSGRIVLRTLKNPNQGEIFDANGIGQVKVNSQDVWVSADGRFTVTFPLSGGETEIRVTATDTYGTWERSGLLLNVPVLLITIHPLLFLMSPLKTNNKLRTRNFLLVVI